MPFSLKPKSLTHLVPALGAVGLLLQIWLMASRNEKGLLASGHPATYLTLLLTVLTLVVLFLTGRQLGGRMRYERLFPASQPGAIGCLVGAVGILLSAVQMLNGSRDLLTLLAGGLGVLAAICLVVLSHYRLKGLRPTFLLRSVVCLYLLLHLVCQYRGWSAEPQLQLYCYPLLASVFLALAGFHRASFDVGYCGRPRYVLIDLGAVYFCCLSLVSADWLFYLTVGFWSYTELCTLRPMKKRSPQGE